MNTPDKTRRLTLIRHANAEQDSDVRDFERPLSKKGWSEAQEVARRFQERGLVLTHALERHAPQHLVVGVVGPVLATHRRCSGDAGCSEEQGGEHAGNRSEEDAGRTAHACRELVHMDSFPHHGSEAA